MAANIQASKQQHKKYIKECSKLTKCRLRFKSIDLLNRRVWQFGRGQLVNKVLGHIIDVDIDVCNCIF